MLEFTPIIKSLWRSKVGPLLIVLQLALSVAIVSNALFFVQQRIDHMARPTGFAHMELSKVSVKQRNGGMPLSRVVQRDVPALQAIPGVQSVAPIYGVPFSYAGDRWGLSDTLHGEPTAIHGIFGVSQTDHRGLDTLGLELAAGRNFHPEEIRYNDPTSPPPPGTVFMMLSESAAAFLFPGQSAVGKTVYLAGEIPIVVVGVYKDMLGIHPSSDTPYHTVFVSMIVDTGKIDYLIRTRGEDRRRVLEDVVQRLKAMDSSRIINHEQTLEEIKDAHYAPDRAMIILLSVVVFLLIFINMLGIIGITTFWVNQRRKHIGIRRALGASRMAIVRYFLVENAILVVVAIVVGAAIAFVSSSYLVRHYAFELLPWGYIPVTGVCVLIITLIAAAVPARRAAEISPREAVASR